MKGASFLRPRRLTFRRSRSLTLAVLLGLCPGDDLREGSVNISLVNVAGNVLGFALDQHYGEPVLDLV